MKALPFTISDEDLIAFVDQWAQLLEKEDYTAAFNFTDHESESGWTSETLREVIKGYGDANENQRVTVQGKPTDISQRKNVTRWDEERLRGIGDIWYDLNIDGFASDLTATFFIQKRTDGLVLVLIDIHVM